MNQLFKEMKNGVEPNPPPPPTPNIHGYRAQAEVATDAPAVREAQRTILLSLGTEF